MTARLPLVALLLTALLAGCLVHHDPDLATHAPSPSAQHGSPPVVNATPDPARYTPTPSPSPVVVNKSPTAAIAASAREGPVPLLVNFTLAGSDADSSQLVWTFDPGFGTPYQGNAADLPAHILVNYTYPKLYTASFRLSDRNTESTAKVMIQAGPRVMVPIQHVTGTIDVGSPESCTENNNSGLLVGGTYVAFDVDPLTAKQSYVATFTTNVTPVAIYVTFYDTGDNQVTDTGNSGRIDPAMRIVTGIVPESADHAALAACGGATILVDYAAGQKPA